MKKLYFTLLMVFGLASMIVIIGCESSDKNDDGTPLSTMSISPSDVTFKATLVTNVLFTVGNGYGPFSWTMDAPSLGSLVASGESAIYTSTTNTGINYIHVTDSSNNTVTAAVKQQ
jgi:hypothetical protein